MSRANPARYPWNGEQLTVREVAERVPAYGFKWIERALKAGASCMSDLARFEAAQQARALERGKVGARITGERLANKTPRFGKGRA